MVCSSLGSHGGGSHGESGGEKVSSVKDFTSHKSGSEHVVQDKGRNTKEGSSELEKKEAESHGQKENSGHYDEHDAVEKGHDVGRKAEGETFKINQGEHAVEKHLNGQEKKGYHRSGFVNKYHKDESGNNSSFYEDSSDESGHKGFEGRGGEYREKAADTYQDGVHDSAQVRKNSASQGVYDKGEG